MHVVLAGPKGSGKSTVGVRLAGLLDLPFAETDNWIEERAEREIGRRRGCRALLRAEGEASFRNREREAVADGLRRAPPSVVATGGQTLLDPESRRALRAAGLLVWLEADPALLWPRAAASGLPAYLAGSPDPAAEFARRAALLAEAARPCADVVARVAGLGPAEAAEAVRGALAAEWAVRLRAPNTLGEAFRLTTFGESHGPAVGGVLDGLPPGLPLDARRVQEALDRRRPGRGDLASGRNEPDRIRILSGVLDGRALGTPVAFVIDNVDARPGDYAALAGVWRPGHADFGFWAKFGLADGRGGGRGSGRETAARVAGGAMALRALAARGVSVAAWTESIAGIRSRARGPGQAGLNPVRCPDPRTAARMEEAVRAAREAGDSVGGVVAVEATGVPPGWGDPVFGKLDARLAGALMSIGGVKGVEVGAGFAAARRRGSRNNDPLRPGPEAGRPRFGSNHAGGVLGGVSTGQPIRLRLAVKPTPSIGLPQRTVDAGGGAREIRIGGRHDPCLVPRLVPVAEAMAALALLDAALLQDRLRPAGSAPRP